MLNRREMLQLSLLASSAAASKCAALPSLAGAGAGFHAVEEEIQRAVAQGQTTGLACAVVHRGTIAWEGGFGLADREAGTVATAHTPFCLASITKVFTATLVATLAQRRHISLDSPAAPFLRASPLQGPNGDPDDVTIRMLGAHCSGLPGTFTAHLTNGPAPPQASTAFLRDYGRLAYPPGQVYEYGNIGFEALGAIVEQLTGQPFGTALQHHLLEPLGLHGSFFSNDLRRLSAAATGYDGGARRIPAYSTSTPPSGELYASAHDLATYLLAHLHTTRARSVLGTAVLHEVQSPVFAGPGGVSSTFGWFTGRLGSGDPYFFKVGGQPGVAARIFLLPSLDLGCVVLTNRTDAMPLVEQCCRQILRRYEPGFEVPREDAGPAPSVFQPTRDIVGAWQGWLRNGGANQPVRFTMRSSGYAAFALSGRPERQVSSIQAQACGFEGTTSGFVECDYAAAFGDRTLVLKLVPQAGRLVGRVTARGTREGLLLANIPYVITLERV